MFRRNHDTVTLAQVARIELTLNALAVSQPHLATHIGVALVELDFVAREATTHTIRLPDRVKELLAL